MDRELKDAIINVLQKSEGILYTQIAERLIKLFEDNGWKEPKKK